MRKCSITMTVQISPFNTDFQEFLSDESKRTGTADAITFPTTEAEVIEAVRYANERGLKLITQGARTGIVAGAVPEGGLIINLRSMNAIGEPTADGVVVQPGALLCDLRDIIEPVGLFFGPDPTETSASIGGMAACNASGAMSFYYGAMRSWVQSLRMVLSDGDVISIKRAENFSKGRSFSLTTESGRTISGQLPDYTMPDVKSAAGYYAADDMDLIDLLIGSEGTLGIITETGLRLTPRPAAINGLTIFLPSEQAAIELVNAARSMFAESEAALVAIEFFNHDALDLLRNAKATNPAFEAIPALKDQYHTAIYVEFHAPDADAIEEAAMELIETVMELGGSDEDTWFATTDRELEPIKAFRHATPEAVNLLIGERKRDVPELTKLGTDMSVPDDCLADALAMYNAGLSERGLESVIFGHIGNNHVHVNILPHDMDQYSIGRELYLGWADKVVKMGGSVSAEHGIGRLKVPFLEMMYGNGTIAQMRALKKLFDPNGLLNPGVMFQAQG
ncbi:MAG: FAD-binding oxidoreductase [Armatimonadetes bacterium]|nr:FAD-binding oxidoreductase [Armatimonadota bacterium]